MHRLFATLGLADIAASDAFNASVANSEVQNNNDDCSACGGSGQLACCDGCTRSYHFTCLDPPREEAPPGELWYCQACDFQPPALQAHGVFPLLLHRLQRQTPTAYKLPLALRNYYEDVITGEDGEYEETNVPSKAR